MLLNWLSTASLPFPRTLHELTEWGGKAPGAGRYARMPTVYSAKTPSTSAPTTMRYQPNAVKSFFLMYPIRNLMETTDMTNAETTRTASQAGPDKPERAHDFFTYA